jgi:alpha-galactosidase
MGRMHHLRTAGVSLILDARGGGVPVVAHWGADLGDLSDAELETLSDALVPAIPSSAVDVPYRVDLVPLPSAGWNGRPGLSGTREGAPSYPLLALTGVAVTDQAAEGGAELVVSLADAESGLEVDTEIQLTAEGILRLQHRVTNTGATPWTLDRLAVALPVPDRAREVLDFSGRWSGERRPQRRPFDHGVWGREVRHGRTGHDSAFLLAAGTDGFGFRQGEIWSAHLAWSGDQESFAESQSSGRRLIGGAEILSPGEVALRPGESYMTPWLHAGWTDRGLDDISRRFHELVRRRRERPLPPRPVTLNTWEAVYFKHDPAKLDQLVDVAAAVGVERFVLDDGWMTGRTDDRHALGDWRVDAARWRKGLHPLVDRVRGKGMEFGLWVEPEMVSLNSELARAHPDWLLTGAPGRMPPPWRHQYTLNLDHPDAFANILTQLNALLEEYPISYLKWDQNRDLLTGASHAQTLAVYRLIDDVRRAHPSLEIESCSSGGGRVDLAILERTDRVWASDTNDPLERQAIQRWTSTLIPPELIGSHVGAGQAHTTGRSTDLSFRLSTALFGSAGIEWDITRASDRDRAALKQWISVYKELRGLLHSGVTVRADPSDEALWVHGIVAPDGSEAVFEAVCIAMPRDAVPGPIRFPGLDPDAVYVVAVVDLGVRTRARQSVAPAWTRASGELRLRGRVLAETGLAAPLLTPAHSLVFRLTRV